MQYQSISPIAAYRSLWLNRALASALIKREIMARYRGSVLGLFWTFINPILMLAIYTFVFSVVFKARWNVGSDSKTEFAMVLFAGLIIYSIFAECFLRAPSMILANTNYVKKVVFPLEILAWVTLGSALFHAMVSLGVWLLAYLFFFGLPHPTVCFLPFILIPLSQLLLGLTWALASIGVYVRDISQFVGIFNSILLFLSPIFYPASALPEKYRPLLLLNPLTPAIEQARDVLFWGKMPNFHLLFFYFLGTSFFAWFGFAWFQKTRKGFADVL